MNDIVKTIPTSPPQRSFFTDLRRFLRSVVRREYPTIPWRSLLLLLYIVSPIDFLPEALLTAIGLVDDAAAFALLVRSVMSDVEKFREWEKVQNSPIT